MRELVGLFDSLSCPVTSEIHAATFSGSRIPSRPGCHVCKDSLGKPALLIPVSGELSGRLLPNVALENLRVEHSIRCHIAGHGGVSIDSVFTILRCLSDERALQEYFLMTIGTIIPTLPLSPSARDLSEAIDKLVELFHALAQAPTRHVQGLWAELFVITQSTCPISMIEAWHSEIDERFDFSSGQQRIEVKSSSDRTRRHFFSLEQAYPPEGTDVLIASVFIERATNGTSLGDLWDEVRGAVESAPMLLMKIERVCLKALGNSWADARTKCFDLQLAEQSLAFYRVEGIPRITADLPQGISEVKFRSDLSLATSVDFIKGCAGDMLFNVIIDGC